MPTFVVDPWQSCCGEICARSLYSEQLEGRRRRESGLGVQQLQFFDEKCSRGKLTLPFGNWDGPMAAVKFAAMAMASKFAPALKALVHWKETGRREVLDRLDKIRTTNNKHK